MFAIWLVKKRKQNSVELWMNCFGLAERNNHDFPKVTRPFVMIRKYFAVIMKSSYENECIVKRCFLITKQVFGSLSYENTELLYIQSLILSSHYSV